MLAPVAFAQTATSPLHQGGFVIEVIPHQPPQSCSHELELRHQILARVLAEHPEVRRIVQLELPLRDLTAAADKPFRAIV